MKYCQNYLCESEAVETVPVSYEKPGDTTRNFCATCHEAYTVGVQHGSMREKAEADKANRAG